MDIVDGHFVEDGDRIFIRGVFGRLEDDLEPGGVGPSFFVEDDVTNAFEAGGFHGGRVIPFIIIYLVVLAEQQGDHRGFWFLLSVFVGYIFWQDQSQGPGPGHGGGEDKESDQEEAEGAGGGVDFSLVFGF